MEYLVWSSKLSNYITSPLHADKKFFTQTSILGNSMSSVNIEFENFLKQSEPCLKLGRAICEKHSLPLNCVRVNEGSQLIFCSDAYIIKIFSPQDVNFFHNEKQFLTHLYQKLTIQTPRLYESGYWEQYPYLIMEKIQGVQLKKVWDSLCESEKKYIMSQLGNTVKSLHSLPPDIIIDAKWNWAPFIERQQKCLVDNHRKYGLEQHWIDQMNEYNFVSIDFQDPKKMVLLHTELMQQHVFVKYEFNHWVLSGLIDFEPSMSGHAEYEFCSVGLFITQGRPSLFREFLSAYGYRGSELNDELRMRIMKFTLLHRYSNLKWYLKMIPPEFHFTRLSQLEQYFFSF